jgi:hypothetical protein
MKDVLPLVPAWRDLLARAARPELVTTPTWLLAFWREFGLRDRRRLAMLAVHDDDRTLIGLVPLASRLALHRRAIPVRRLELLPSGEDEVDEICSDYTGAIVAEGKEEEVARAPRARG